MDVVVRKFVDKGDQESKPVEVAVYRDPGRLAQEWWPEIARFGRPGFDDSYAHRIFEDLGNHVVNGNFRQPWPQHSPDLAGLFCIARFCSPVFRLKEG